MYTYSIAKSRGKHKLQNWKEWCLTSKNVLYQSKYHLAFFSISYILLCGLRYDIIFYHILKKVKDLELYSCTVKNKVYIRSNGDFANHFDATTQVTRHDIASFLLVVKLSQLVQWHIKISKWVVCQISQNCTCHKSWGQSFSYWPDMLKVEHT